MKMSLSKAVALRTALQNCDGHQVVIKENGADKSVFCLYELGFDARYGIAKNLNELNVVYENYIKTRNDLVRSISKTGTGIAPDDMEGQAKFFAEEVKLSDQETDINLIMLDKAHFVKSNLPASVLSSIMVIIKE